MVPGRPGACALTVCLASRSFAMIMIELYTGERLFKGMEAHQLMFLVRPTAQRSSALPTEHLRASKSGVPDAPW